MEVIGQVEPDFTIREFKTTNLGDSFGKYQVAFTFSLILKLFSSKDLELANKVVELAQQCPEIFE